MRIAIVLSLIIATPAIVFAVINPVAVDINFGFFTVTGASLPLVLITTLLLGLLIGYLLWLPARMAMKRRIRSLDRMSSQTPTVEPVRGEEEPIETDLPPNEPIS